MFLVALAETLAVVFAVLFPETLAVLLPWAKVVAFPEAFPLILAE